MLSRVIPFFIAVVLLLAGGLASGNVASVTPGGMHPAQELMSGDDQPSDEATTVADAETLSDIPDLLVGPLAASSADAAMPQLRPHVIADRAPPDLRLLLRPPSESGLHA